MVIWEGLLDGLGTMLATFYQVIPSYGVAIILLTVLVRVVLIPLTVKQMRSMQAMQKLQPKVKELQRKHKGNRQKLNEEMMKLYKEHGANPLGGCLPLLLQLPVFFALFSVLRSPVEVVATPAETVQASVVEAEGTSCRPNTPLAFDGQQPTEVICEGPQGIQTFTITEWQSRQEGQPVQPPSYLLRCLPQTESPGEGQAAVVRDFKCETPLGARHLPPESQLFADVVEDRATFLGMHLACSPTQAGSEDAIRQCSPEAQAGGFPLVGYYGLVALMVVSTWYQQKQMQRASAGPQAAQMKMMGRIMPVFLGFISISISTGVLVYWVTTNGWQIGQQYLMLRSRVSQPGAGPTSPAKPDGPPKDKPGPQGGKTEGGKTGRASGDGQPPRPRGSSGGRSARSRKKRRKR